MGNLGLTAVAILLLIRYTKFHFLNSLREVNLSLEFCEKNTRSKMYLKQLIRPLAGVTERPEKLLSFFETYRTTIRTKPVTIWYTHEWRS